MHHEDFSHFKRSKLESHIQGRGNINFLALVKLLIFFLKRGFNANTTIQNTKSSHQENA